MLLDERQSKKIFGSAKIPVPPSLEVRPEDDPAPGFPAPWMLKSQVLSGGRGKAGGVVKVQGRDALHDTMRKLFDLPIKGSRPPLLLLEPAAEIEREFYVSMAVSRDRESLLFTVKAAGGMEVEADGIIPALIQKVRLPGGPTAAQIRCAFFHMGLEREQLDEFAGIVNSLFEAVIENGLLLAEINPLAQVKDNGLMALDAKVEVDDSVADLREDLSNLREPGHYGEKELTAKLAGLSYVGLDGSVGCVVNGAGLSMATMDALNFAGIAPANFLDLGGAADSERMQTAMELLLDDDKVEALFINLYGGILSCSAVADALLEVLDGEEPKKPIVARISGNNAELGRKKLRDVGLKGLVLAEDMAHALSLLGALVPHEGGRRFEELGTADATYNFERRPVRRPLDVPNPLDFGPHTKVLVQGLTGRAGKLHAGLMRQYGANIVAGVTPFKGGCFADSTPIYDNVQEAAADHQIDLSIIFVPAPFVADAIMEAADAKVPWIVCITEGTPQLDMLKILPALRESGSSLIGPNTPGLIVPGRFKAGIMPTDPFSPGSVAVLSRSGTLTYEASARLTAAGLGQAIACGVGGDPFIGLGFAEMLDIVRDDPRVESVLLLGEIGGRAEEDAAAYISSTSFAKPVVSFVAGLTAPPGRRMGHAGAILEEGGGVERKLSALRSAGIEVCASLDELPEAVRRGMSK
ncbi:succinate--CoA ligase subunit alpha [Pseudodesulfovibrio sp.]|uniref:succinate--CoA ligase subunit alpha n=1 Tax=unclassified Pseudodesulfovibrio TaxID=2661612 RepID=UPI003B002750